MIKDLELWSKPQIFIIKLEKSFSLLVSSVASKPTSFSLFPSETKFISKRMRVKGMSYYRLRMQLE